MNPHDEQWQEIVPKLIQVEEADLARQDAMALGAELAFNRPELKFGQITTDQKLDNVVARNDRSNAATDAEGSTPASASSRRRFPPVAPDAMLIPRISRPSSSPPSEPEK